MSDLKPCPFCGCGTGSLYVVTIEQHGYDTVGIFCNACKHRHLVDMIWICPFGLPGGEDFFCAYGVKDGDSDDE